MPPTKSDVAQPADSPLRVAEEKIAPSTSSALKKVTAISDVAVITPHVARYEKFEVQFDAATVATDLSLPFDAHPPPGVHAGTGVNVDGLFSSDNGTTVITQSGFLIQPYVHTIQDARDHFIPSGSPRWAVRFAPQTAGTWQYRLRVADAAGSTIWPDGPSSTFTVGTTASNPYTRRGFLHVSPTDQRYFAFDDGTPFVGVGFNTSFGNLGAAEQQLARYEAYKMNFMRVWLSGSGINGSQWTSWASHHLENDSYLPGVQYDTQHTFNGADVALKLDGNNPCVFADFWQGGVPVEPSATYRVTARVRVNGVTGPGSDTGFVIKQAGWLGTECAASGEGTPITAPVSGTTDWITVTGTYTTNSTQHWLDNLYLARQHANSGEVYVDDVRVWRADDPAQINLLREPNANSHMSFDPMNAARWDLLVDEAAQHGVYLKLVIDEKNEWIRNHIAADGSLSATGSNDNLYAAPHTKVRWLEQAWGRYLVARWGYSTAIHSFEYINEGDPYNGHHHEAANAFAQYVHSVDPARHMVTTSFWAAFPNQEFWSNPQYPDLDYADIHAYISTGWGRTASFIDPSWLETRPQYVHSGNAAVHVNSSTTGSEAITPRGLVIHGPGEWIVRYWMKTSDFTANCPFGTSGGMQRVRWQLDGGPFAGGSAGVVPFNSDGKDFICTSSAGTYDWQAFRSDHDRDGAALPQTRRIILTDSAPHEIILSIENTNATGGDAWIDDVELVNPAGQVVPVIGQFDMTPMDDDTAWYNRAYGDLLGAASPVGAHKPLVRGEGGIDAPDKQDWLRELNQDSAGIWLHNNVWGQINAGGMYDLMWWASETIDQNSETGRATDIYTSYLTFRSFMDGIPLNNGLYRDADARTSDPAIRVWGQRDAAHGRAHLWVQNTEHTWRRAAFGPAITPISATITLPGMPSGPYRVTWWDTYRAEHPIIQTQIVTVTGQLDLPLPTPLATDIAVQIEPASRLPGLYLPSIYHP